MTTPACATPQQELTEALRDYLFRILADTPRDERGRWVMSAEWLTECLKLDDRPPPFGAKPVTLLGIPIEVRDGAGAPWLVPSGEPS